MQKFLCASWSRELTKNESASTQREKPNEKQPTILQNYKRTLRYEARSSRESLGWKLPVHYRPTTFCSSRFTLCASVRTRSENSGCLCVQNICPTPRIECAIYFSVISSDGWKQKYRGAENDWMVGMMRQFISLCNLPMKRWTTRYCRKPR